MKMRRGRMKMKMALSTGMPECEENPLASPRREVNRFAGAFEPPIDVRETDCEIVVAAELPGLDEKDFELNVSPGTLVLRGEKRIEHPQEGALHQTERRYGPFHRMLVLPCEIETDKVRTQYRDGLLTITLPKLPSGRRRVRRIEVKTCSRDFQSDPHAEPAAREVRPAARAMTAMPREVFA